MLAYCGPPKIFHSDNGREFVNQLIRSMFDRWGGDVTFVNCRPRHSHSQGLVERGNRVVERKLAAMKDDNGMSGDKYPWASWLPRVMWAMNSERHRTIQDTPYRLLFGRSPPAGIFPGAQEHCLSEEALGTQASDNSVDVPNPTSSASTPRIPSSAPSSPASQHGSSHSSSLPELQTLAANAASVCHSTPLSSSSEGLSSPGISHSLPDLDTDMDVDAACPRPSSHVSVANSSESLPSPGISYSLPDLDTDMDVDAACPCPSSPVSVASSSLSDVHPYPDVDQMDIDPSYYISSEEEFSVDPLKDKSETQVPSPAQDKPETLVSSPTQAAPSQQKAQVADNESRSVAR